MMSRGTQKAIQEIMHQPQQTDDGLPPPQMGWMGKRWRPIRAVLYTQQGIIPRDEPYNALQEPLQLFQGTILSGETAQGFILQGVLFRIQQGQT